MASAFEHVDLKKAKAEKEKAIDALVEKTGMPREEAEKLVRGK